MGLLPIHEAMLDVEVHMDGEFVGDTHLLDSSSEDLDTSEDSSQEDQHPTQTAPHPVVDNPNMDYIRRENTKKVGNNFHVLLLLTVLYTFQLLSADPMSRKPNTSKARDKVEMDLSNLTTTPRVSFTKTCTIRDGDSTTTQLLPFDKVSSYSTFYILVN